MKMNYALLVIALILMASEPVIGAHYYCRLGPQRLEVCDSIVTIRFDPSYPAPDFGAFAYGVPALDENRMPEAGYRRFYTFWVESGYNIDTLIDDLRDIDVVLYANPAYNDSYGNLFRLADLFIISYKPAVAQWQIDSIQAFYNVLHFDGPYRFTGTRRLLISPETPGNPLEIANAFYESGLVKYAQALMAPAEPDSYEPDDSLFPQQYYLYNYGQNGGTPGIDIDIKKAWEITQGDSNAVVVAIIDDGCVQLHEDVEGSKVLLWQGHDFIGDNPKYPFEDDDPRPGDSCNHGVAIQGIISAKTDNELGIAGIAPKCHILPTKIAGDHEGPGNWTGDPAIYESAISYAIDFALSSNYLLMVMSCSWG